jgi:uroporphyrinogen-III synthase
VSGGAPQGSAARRSILVTRPSFDTQTATLIEARGYRPVSAPLLHVEHRALAIPHRVQAVLVTSSNALLALGRLLPGESTRPILAVGDATAERARAQGFCTVLSAGGDATALAELAARIAVPSEGPLLLASGAGQGQGLAADLRRRGFRVIRRVCYAARPVRRFPAPAADALRSGELHAAMFLSAETASAFVRLLPLSLRGQLAGVAALAIGQTTADALEPLPWLRVCRARAPTLDDVLALL